MERPKRWYYAIQGLEPSWFKSFCLVRPAWAQSNGYDISRNPSFQKNGGSINSTYYI